MSRWCWFGARTRTGNIFVAKSIFSMKFPIHPTSLTRFRNRIGDDGCELLLQETINVGLKTDVVKTSEIAKINVDTTVQPKAIKYPTDSSLHHQCRNNLVKLCKRHGIVLRQTF
jgi:IS5 family transposase